jgi:hypothetical protein
MKRLKLCAAGPREYRSACFRTGRGSVFPLPRTVFPPVFAAANAPSRASASHSYRFPDSSSGFTRLNTRRNALSPGIPWGNSGNFFNFPSRSRPKVSMSWKSSRLCRGFPLCRRGFVILSRFSFLFQFSYVHTSFFGIPLFLFRKSKCESWRYLRARAGRTGAGTAEERRRVTLKERRVYG